LTQHPSLARHRSARLPETGVSGRSRDRWLDPERVDVTDIIPFNEFDDLDDDDVEFRDNTAFDSEASVLRAPELDDLTDTDNLTPLLLEVPAEFHTNQSGERQSGERYQDPYAYLKQGTDVTGAPVRRGSHRKPIVGPVRGRMVVAAMAVGAAAAASNSAINDTDSTSAQTVLAADQTALNGASQSSPSRGIQLVSVKPATVAAVHREELAKGAAFAQERADREARLARPLYVRPALGMFTSRFGYRWGALHGGIDIAGPIGTPIYAVSDGVVIDAGPSGGYGMLVKLRHSDGTVTLYGHVNSTLVNIGTRVMAGDQIATMGNTGYSTGPHLHFEVLRNGTDRTNPVSWLAERGLRLGG